MWELPPFPIDRGRFYLRRNAGTPLWFGRFSVADEEFVSFFDSFVPLAIVYRISVRVNRIFSNVRGVMPDDTNSEFHKILNYFPAGFENFFRSLCPI